MYRTISGGAFPGADGNAATFKSNLAPYVCKFPVLHVVPADAQDAEVAMDIGTGARIHRQADASSQATAGRGGVDEKQEGIE